MMTSSASNTSLLATKSEEVPETPEKNNENNGTATANTFNPITDIIQTSTPRSARSKTKTTPTRTTTTPKSTSKIPYPLTTLLTNKTNQFRRCASLRLRGPKSNLLTNFNAFNIGTMDTKLVNEVNTRTGAAAAVKDDLPSTGRISPRRKLVLNSQNLTDTGLTRSLSLRRDHHTSHKTDSLKDSSSPLKAIDAKDNDTTDCQEREVPDGNHISDDVNKAKQTEFEENMDEIVTKTANINAENMSLNLNGATSTSTQSRPATLATGKVTTTASSKSASSPKTSKTLTTTPSTPSEHQQLNNQNSHSKHLHHHHHCTTLPSVPETKLTPKTPPVTPDSPSTYLDDDLDSLYSFATTTSGRSTMSCEHPYVARNGTTFSGRKMKYVVHCSNYAGQVGPDYLTPTQRAQRQIRRLKELLCVARHDLEQKDSEILRLTREVVELRLFKASLSSPEERSASSDAVTVRENELKTSQDVSPIVDMVDDAAKSSPRHIVGVGHHQQHLHNHHSAGCHNAMQLSSDMQSSFADSGHFEDMTSSSVHSKEDSYAAHHTHDMACGSDEVGEANGGGSENEYEVQRQELIRLYEQRIEELIRNQDSASSEMKRTHNDKVEALLQKLAECNTRYADIVPDYEHAKERIRELEKQLEDLQRKLAEHEEKQNKMYLHMYQQGQEAERIARADQALELAHRAPNNKVSINELLQQLQSTQDELENIRTIYRRLLDAQKNRTHVDPEVTLQFLKSAVYYFLTDKENSQGHLQAIESILEFTEAEKLNINKARSSPK